MKQTGKVFSVVTFLFFVFLIVGCSDLKNPIEADNTISGEQEDSFLFKGKKGLKGSSSGLQTSNTLACGAVDDVMLFIPYVDTTFYEDAEDETTDRWFINWMDPIAKGNATISNVYDSDHGSRVIEFFDDGSLWWFILGNGFGDWNHPWNNTTQFTLQWSMRYRVDFIVMLRVLNSNGELRELRYVPKGNNNGPNNWGHPTMIYGLGSDADDGKWHIFTRDLKEDFENAFDDETIGTVVWFKIRGECDYAPAPFCEDGQKPQMLKMEYTGEGCDASNHSQDPGKVSCWGDPNYASPVRIIATDKEDPFHDKAKVFFDGQVALGGTFNIDAVSGGATKLKADTYVSIFDLDNNILQTIKFHTSCSQPLNIGDQFGSLIIVGGIMTTGKGK